MSSLRFRTRVSVDSSNISTTPRIRATTTVFDWSRHVFGEVLSRKSVTEVSSDQHESLAPMLLAGPGSMSCSMILKFHMCLHMICFEPVPPHVDSISPLGNVRLLQRRLPSRYDIGPVKLDCDTWGRLSMDEVLFLGPQVVHVSSCIFNLTWLAYCNVTARKGCVKLASFVVCLI